MAKFLQQLLDAKEPLFTHGLIHLEKATGNTGIDARLIGDIHEKAYGVMRKLGLDPKDTTTKELWAALHGKYAKDTLKNTAYVGLVTVDGVVSFNENDVKRNKNRGFEDRTSDAMKQALVQELRTRYSAASSEVSAHVKELMDDAGIKTLNLDDRQKEETK